MTDLSELEALVGRGVEYLNRLGEGGWGDGDLREANAAAQAIESLLSTIRSQEAALVEAREALGNLLADIDATSTFEGWSEGHKPLADKLDYDVLKAARAIVAQEKSHD